MQQGAEEQRRAGVPLDQICKMAGASSSHLEDGLGVRSRSGCLLKQGKSASWRNICSETRQGRATGQGEDDGDDPRGEKQV